MIRSSVLPLAALALAALLGAVLLAGSEATDTADAQETALQCGFIEPDHFLLTFDGDPVAPAPLGGSTEHQMAQECGVTHTVHQRDTGAWTDFKDVQGHHSETCSPPGHNAEATHPVTTYEDAVYKCKNHVMTAVGSPGYGAITETFWALADWSNGTATIRWDMSTWRTSIRDWITVEVCDFDDLILLPLQDIIPDGQGWCRNGIHYDVVQQAWNWTAREFVDGQNFGMYYPNESRSWVYGLQRDDPSQPCYGPSPQTRITFEIQIDTTSTSVARPGCGGTLYTRNFPVETPFTSGVVQIIHHSYSPDKGAKTHWDPPLDGSANTWHIDNVSIQPARPLTVIGADERHIAGDGVTNFTSPAPADSTLLFLGNGDVSVSFDGQTFQSPPPYVGAGASFVASESASYRVAVPEGATWVQIVAQRAHGMVVVSEGAPSEPTPSPTTSPSPSATATSTPSPSQTATASPAPSATPSTTPSLTPTATPSATPSPTPSASPTPSPTPTPDECAAMIRINGEARWEPIDCETGAYIDLPIGG